MSDETVPFNPDEVAENAFQEFQQANLANARVLCDQVLGAYPEHYGALLVLNLIDMQEKQFDDAIAVLNRMMKISPTPDALQKLANCYYAIGDLEPALGNIQTALELDPERPGAHTALAAILHGFGRYEEALDVALEGERRNPADNVASARVASIFERLGRFDEAQQQFRKARDLGAPNKPYSVLSFDRKVFELIIAEPRRRAAPAHRFGSREPAGFRFVIFACCDSGYFTKYGFNFVNSFARNALQDNLLHVHIVDPNPELDATLNKITHDISLANLVVSTESSPYGEPGMAPPTYYSCCRFLRLPFLLDKYRVPVICLDIDAIVERPLSEIVDHVAGCDVGLLQRNPPHSPWLDIPAGIVVANPTASARRYFDLAGNYMAHFMRRGEAKWHLDQAALYCVLRMQERFGGTRDTRLLPQSTKQFSPDAWPKLPSAPKISWLPLTLRDSVWQIGHDHDYRLRETRFTQYSSAAGTKG